MGETFNAGSVNPAALDIIGDRYLIEEMEIKNRVGAIVLAAEDPTTLGWMAGRIIAVGDGARLENNEMVNMRFNPGDVIICERMTGREVNLLGKKFRLVNQTHVYARVLEADDTVTDNQASDPWAQLMAEAAS